MKPSVQVCKKLLLCYFRAKVMGCQYFCLRRPVYFLSRPMVVFFRVIRITLMDHCWLYICFYRATLNTGRSSREKGVCLSVRLSDRLSNVWLVTKKEEKSVQILYHRKDHYLVFWEKNGWWGGWPLLPEISAQTDRVGAKSPIFSRYSLVAPQP